MLSRCSDLACGQRLALLGALAAGLCAPPLRAQDFVYGPWLQDVRPDGIAVLWRADQVETPAPQVVVLTTGGVEVTRVDAQPAAVNGQTVYSARLSGLSAATCYGYAVRSGSTQLDGLSLCTARPTGQSGFRFYVAGDSRSSPAVWGQIARRILDDVQQDPARHQTLLLHTGDLVGDGSIAANWDELWPPARELLARLPMYTAYGNHEDRNTATSDAFVYGFFESPAVASGSGDEKWYAVDYGALHVPAVAIYDDVGYASGAQSDWLSSDLAGPAQAASVHWRVGLVHFAPWSLGNHGESDAAGLRAVLHPQYRDFGVPLVFAGHNHLYARYEPVDGVAYVTSGGGGAPLHTGTYDAWSGAVLAHAAAVYQFVVVDVEAAALTLRAVDSQGRLFDVATYGKVAGNRPPAAVAGDDQRAQVGDVVLLDGSASFDPELTTLTHAWEQRAGPDVVLDDAALARPSFRATQAGRLQFHLRVTDDQQTSPPDLVQIEVVDEILQLTPVADTFVDSATPDTGNGSASVLQVDDSPSTARAFLRFTVPTDVAQVQQATLRLYCVNSGAPPAVSTSPDVEWEEAGTTWNQAPTVTAGQLGSLSATTTAAWSEVDVSPAVSTAGALTLVLLPTGGDGADFESREGAHPPQLVLAVRTLPVDAGATDLADDAASAGDVPSPDGAPLEAGPPADAAIADAAPTDSALVDATGALDATAADGDPADRAHADLRGSEAGSDLERDDLELAERPDSGAQLASRDASTPAPSASVGCGCQGAPVTAGWGAGGWLLLRRCRGRRRTWLP